MSDSHPRPRRPAPHPGRGDEPLNDLHREVIETLDLPVARFLPDGRLTFLNDAACRLVGQSREALLGRSFLEFVPAEYREATLAHLASLEPEAPLGSHRQPVLLPGGGVRWMEWTNRALFDEKGRAVELQGWGRDVTAQVAEEDARREAEERFRTVFEHAALGIAVVDLGGRIVEANPALATILGASPEALCGRHYAEFTDPEGLAAEQALFQELLDGARDGYRIDKQYRTVSGDIRWGRLAVSLLRAPDGTPRFMIGLVEDVTARRDAEAALRESEAKYRHLFETMAQGVVYQDARGRILAVNPAAEAILGGSLAELRGRTPEDPRWMAVREDGTPFPGTEHPAAVALRTGRGVRGVILGVWNPREECRRWLRVHAVPKFRPGEPAPHEVYTVFEDLTERRALEDRLRREVELREVLLETSPAFFLVLEPDTRVRLMNRAFLEATGYGREEVEGTLFLSSLIAPEEWAEVQGILDHAAATGEPAAGENRLRTRDGRHLRVEWAGRPVRDADGAVRNFFAFGVDVTERRRSEERLRRYQAQLRALASELAQVEERERRRFATELHDAVGQVLALARLKLGAARQDRADPALEEVDALLESAVRQTRSLTFDLSPPVLHELGLLPAVEWLLEEVGRGHGVATSLNARGFEEGGDEATRLLAFRVLQELVTNALKHGEPRRVRVSLAVRENRLVLEVRDDGAGLPPGRSRPTSRGFGLFSIRERLRPLGGRLRLSSVPGRGTLATVTIPLERPAG